MDNEESKKSERRKIYIPTNIRTRTYFFEGFGFTELIQTILFTVLIGLFDIIYFLISKNEVIAVTTILIAIAVGVTLFTKDKTNMSVVDYIKDLIIFSKSQKRYLYDTNIKEDIHDIIQSNQEEN